MTLTLEREDSILSGIQQRNHVTLGLEKLLEAEAI
jgi:hypothetical protein